MYLTKKEQGVALDALQTSLPDLMDYAVPEDYETGALERLVKNHVDLITKLNGSIAHIGGKNGDLMSSIAEN